MAPAGNKRASKKKAPSKKKTGAEKPTAGTGGNSGGRRVPSKKPAKKTAAGKKAAVPKRAPKRAPKKGTKKPSAGVDQTSSAQGVSDEELVALRTRLEREAREHEAIHDISRAILRQSDLNELLELILDHAVELVDAERGTIYLVDEPAQELWSSTAHGLDGEIRLPLGTGVAGWVATHGEAVNIEDPYDDPRFVNAFDARTGFRTRSLLTLPMMGEADRTVGVLQLLNKRTGAFDDEDAELLATLASHAAISIETSRLYRSVVAKNLELFRTKIRLEQKMGELDALFQLERETGAALDVDRALEAILRSATDLCAASAGAILLREAQSGRFIFRAARGGRPEEVKQLSIGAEEGIIGWVARTGEPVVLNNPMRDGRFDRTIADKVEYHPRNMICAPLRDEGVIGGIELLDKIGADGFDADDLKLLTILAGQASKVIQMSRARERHFEATRLETIGQAISGLLHDLKTPMTIISGYVQLMAAETQVKKREEYSQNVLQQFDNLDAMTREVLAFARGETQLLVRKVYLHQFGAELERHFKPMLAGTRVDLEMDIAYRGAAYFDEMKLLRASYNLARNAIQAMPDGGTLRVGIDADGDDLLLRFSDTGKGIPNEVRGRMFESFVSHGKKDGTGLGLSIVRNIVNSHGGHIEYITSPDKGTTFSVRLPMQGPRPGNDPDDTDDLDDSDDPDDTDDELVDDEAESVAA